MDLLYNIFEAESDDVQEHELIKVNACRGWSKISLFSIVSVSACRGWSKITLCSL